MRHGIECWTFAIARRRFTRMQLSGVLITHQLSDEAVGWFSAARGVVDELVAFVDEDRAAPDLDDRLRELDARIINTRSPAFYKADFAAMVAECRGDWLLKIDYDEELSREWHDPRWREILEQDEFTYFWVPRRWVVGAGNYIASEPWWPDWQLRLFRNRPSDIIFPQQLHETMQMTGPAGYLRTLAIHHHDLRVASRPAREAKAATYEKQRPGGGLGFFYVYEDHELPELPLPDASAFAPGREVLRMQMLSDEEITQLSINADAPPTHVPARGMFWANVTLTNGTDRALCTGAPFPVNFAYHWLDTTTGNAIVFDGERTAILPELPPQQTANFRMFVTAPAQPGEYLLRITLVQEQVRWLDQQGAESTHDFQVSVIAPGSTGCQPVPSGSLPGGS